MVQTFAFYTKNSPRFTPNFEVHPVYNTMYNIYNVAVGEVVKPDVVVTEDSNSGNDFFKAAFSCSCVSAGGKSWSWRRLKTMLQMIG